MLVISCTYLRTVSQNPKKVQFREATLMATLFASKAKINIFQKNSNGVEKKISKNVDFRLWNYRATTLFHILFIELFSHF